MEASGGDPATGMPVIMVFFLVGFLIFQFGIDFKRAHADIAPTLKYRHNFENVQPNEDKVKCSSFISLAKSDPFREPCHTLHTLIPICFDTVLMTVHLPPRPIPLIDRLHLCHRPSSSPGSAQGRGRPNATEGEHLRGSQ